jgi:predicted Rossmann-fold nucleotide-binding protein
MNTNNNKQHKHRVQLHTLEQFRAAGHALDNVVVQNLDFRGSGIKWNDYSIERTVFLGCTFENRQTAAELVARGALLFPEFRGLPYDPYRQSLYTWQELMAGYSFEDDRDESCDKNIYEYFERTGRESPDIVEALARRIHDHAIDNALQELIEGKRVVGICGGHSVRRTNPYYLKVAVLTRLLTLQGYLVAGGGGPGIMEACNLGAYFSTYTEKNLETAVKILGKSPHYADPGHAALSREVVDRFPDGGESLAIPTWFYGHEPSNLFASHIAKYFSNSIREDGLLAIAKHGIVFAPGSAGTTQEIFMDAVQNHYGSFGCYSPMVFLGTDRYTKETAIFPLLEQLAVGRKYKQMLTITDLPQEALAFITSHPPVPSI